MIEPYEAIKAYESKVISLEELQEIIWGLSELSLELISKKELEHYLSL